MRRGKPRQPVVTEFYDIAQADQTDHEPPAAPPAATNFHLGKKFASKIAKHMRNQRKSKKVVTQTDQEPPAMGQDTLPPGAAEEKIVKKARRHDCRTYRRQEGPRRRRAAVIPRARGLNEVMSVDVVKAPGAEQGTAVRAPNMVDRATQISYFNEVLVGRRF